MASTILRRDSSSEGLEGTILDTIFVVSVFVLCVLILAVALLHCVLRRRNRQTMRNWTSCSALKVISSSPSPQSSAFSKDMEYIFCEVEINPNSNASTGKDWAFGRDKFSSDNEKVGDLNQGIKSTSWPTALIVPLSASPVFLPPK